MRLERFELYPQLVAVFTGRQEGNLAGHTGQDPERVARNRERLAAELGMAPERLGLMRQVHSAVVAPVAEPGAQPPEADGLVDASGLRAPVVLTADCVPVLFAARAGAVALLAAAHAGRKGLLDGVLLETARQLESAGGTGLEAWIGPSICGACYEVPAQMQVDSEARMPGISATTSWGTPSLDLVGAAATQLRSLGVAVHSTGICTLHDEGYFSYRGADASPRNASLVYSL
ncbi:polyphenol oxidase family protein [Galactobacter caseinivorans]|uniref:Laccase domain-containing protein n=1 Tax=Galactobacter caseinivorans TaxID=2676123 RepID=A0A496PM92_9MICC|nr:polyphenol oxidase family protein [Galactobacter caseinivorans]RKW71668.1 laccase domain-containing protein [Galactobacter caseinivorans]